MKKGFIIGVSIAAAALLILLVLPTRTSRTGSSGVGAVAPDFAVEDLDGKIVRLSDLKGQAVVVNFWATWCPPCRREIPTFIELQKKYGPQGLRIVGIAMDDSGRGTVEQFVRANGINYSVAMQTQDVVRSYGGIELLPTTFYIGRDGKVTHSASGLMSASAIEDHVRAALAARL